MVDGKAVFFNGTLGLQVHMLPKRDCPPLPIACRVEAIRGCPGTATRYSASHFLVGLSAKLSFINADARSVSRSEHFR